MDDREPQPADAMRYWQPPPSVRRGYVDGRFGQVHVRTAGSASSAPAVLCLHQSPSSARPFEMLMAELATDRLVIAPDTPGFGDSDPPPMVPTVADYAAAAGDVLDRLGIARVDVFGDHTGSKVAIELARQRPHQVRRLALNSAPIYTAAEMDDQLRHLAEERPAVEEPPEDGSFWRERWARIRGHYAPETPLAMFDRDFAEMIRPRDIAWYGHNASWRYSLAAALPSLAHRVLVLNPDDMLAEPTRRVPGYMRNGRLLELPGWRLGAVSLRAAELAGLLRRFFDEPAADGGTSQPVAAPTRTSPAARAIYRRFVDTPDGQVHVRMTRPRAQRRPPLVCFHFSPVHGGQYEALMPELGDDRMVLALDTPGYGESFKPRRRPEVADLAASAVRTIEALGLAQVDVLGDHTGSKIAVDVARQRPALVRRIVMNTANAYTAAEIGLWQGRMGTIPAAEDGAHVVALWDRLMNLNRGKMTRPRVAHRFYQTMRAGPCMWWGPKASHYYALGDVLPQLDHEILIVASTDDSTIEPTRRTAPLLKRGRLVEFAGFGNAMIEYRAPEVAPTIRAFLDA